MLGPFGAKGLMLIYITSTTRTMIAPDSYILIKQELADGSHQESFSGSGISRLPMDG